ncbi:hypothetical protein B0H14DRAFT_2352385 [Mycena olivaceomarginata]|nr:hypothetical protein B0H14DRAFT_2352385 [Mycena olivaceomarginata]
MVNRSGANRRYNGTRKFGVSYNFCHISLTRNFRGPPDSVLGPTLHEYARKSLSLDQQCDYLLKDFGYKTGKSTLKKLNRGFKVPTVKKPPPDHIASTLVAEVMQNNVSSRNGPRTVQNQISLQDGTKIPCIHFKFECHSETLFVVLWPKLIQARFPGHQRQSKQRGQLTDSGVYHELHFDGHKKLNFKALQMGPVGIDIYGSRCHSSSKIVNFLVVPNAHCSSTVEHYYLDLVAEHGDKLFVQATVDGGSDTGELYAAHLALR